jgi:hypothetical protein
MKGRITVRCCCCKKEVALGENPPENPAEIRGWVSIDRKAYCADCFSGMTEEDIDEWGTPPVALGLAEIARLKPGDVEPL